MDLLGKHESCINHDISIIVSNQHAIHANLPKPTDWQDTQWRSIGPFVKGFHLTLHCIVSAPACSLEVATSVTLPWLVCGRCCCKIPQTRKPEFVRTNLHNLITLPIPLGNVRNFIPLCISHLIMKNRSYLIELTHFEVENARSWSSCVIIHPIQPISAPPPSPVQLHFFSTTAICCKIPRKLHDKMKMTSRLSRRCQRTFSLVNSKWMNECRSL